MNETVYILADKVGGIASLNSNLIRLKPPSGPDQRAILTREQHDPDTRLTVPLGADQEARVNYSNLENRFAIFRRLEAEIPPGSGPLISNNTLELELFSTKRSSRTIYQIVHDEYNFGLSKLYETAIDVMIAHSRFYYEKLLTEFPQRKERIFYAPYGILLAPVTRSAAEGPLRLVFLGRLHKNKGVHDLPQIDDLLRAAGVDVVWSVIGDGPERESLLRTWPETDRVRYWRPPSNEEVLRLCSRGDVFVFPTRFEGFPVALLEAMSAGLTPVVSDLPSGIPEVVIPGVGFRIPLGNVPAFAEAISGLSRDRGLLESMSRAAREQAERFDIQDRARTYHHLFARWAEFKRPDLKAGGPRAGSRLDQRWLPNSFVRAIRSLRNRISPHP